MLLHDPIALRAARRPELEALWTPAGTWTYAELDAAVGTTARRLAEGGVESGTRVGLRMGRGPAAVVGLWALWRLGAVAVPISRRLPAERVANTLRRAGTGVLVTDENALFTTLQQRRTGPLVRRAHSVIDARPDAPGGPAPRALPANRPATLVFTSGSTGTPKAALHTWQNHHASAAGSNANLPLEAGDRWLASLPLYHVGGLAVLVRCALGGASVALPDSNATLPEALGTTQATHASLVATQLHRLLGHLAPNEGAGSLKAVLVGGSAVPEALLDAAVARGWPVHTTYGCTETASQVTTTPPGADRDTLRTSGRVLPGRRLRIDDDGRICVRGATLFRGYVDGGPLHDPRDADGWYRTGDLGHLDREGRLHVTGRADRMFISGGENVQPEEIESALEALPEVVQAAVVAVPDAEFGARPIGFVRTTDGTLPPQWREALGQAMARFKIPDALYSLPDEALQSGMKVDREYLTKQARTLRRG